MSEQRKKTDKQRIRALELQLARHERKLARLARDLGTVRDRLASLEYAENRRDERDRACDPVCGY